MYIAWGLAAMTLGCLFFVGRNFLGALNDLSNTFVTGRATPPEAEKDGPTRPQSWAHTV
jgi:hypothetical protein